MTGDGGAEGTGDWEVGLETLKLKLICQCGFAGAGMVFSYPCRFAHWA
jgi:hypothetical protein